MNVLHFNEDDEVPQEFIIEHRNGVVGRIVKKRVNQLGHWCLVPGSEVPLTNGLLKEIVVFISSLYVKTYYPGARNRTKDMFKGGIEELM